MDRERAIERIRKCLALSKSPNEHEAAAALRQAQKLMLAHEIDPDEVELSVYGSDFVDHDEYKFARKRKPMVITTIVWMIEEAFGVMAVFECSPMFRHRIRYFGKKANVMLAVHAHTVSYRAACSAWEKYKKANPHSKGVTNARASFFVGWTRSVRTKIESLAPDEEETATIKKKQTDHYQGSLGKDAKVGSKTLYSDAIRDGEDAGEKFSINRPMGTDRKYLEKKS